MTINLPAELKRDLLERARELGVTVDDVIGWALVRELYVDRELQTEFDDWQRTSWEAWAKVEDSLRQTPTES